MNFFEAQDRARASTTRLVVLFVLAVITLIVLANLLVMVVLGFASTEGPVGVHTVMQQFDWGTAGAVSLGVGAVVLAGSLYKIHALSAGGKVIAQALGGRALSPDTTDPKERRLLNVVEEIAIASATPVPPVYLLAGEAGINAFAAGFSPRDAVIGVTRGTVDNLGRGELQGVIAHEFSHIFNGDMRLNIRLMGFLNGILVLGIIGYYLLRSASLSGRRRSSGGSGAGAMLALGLGLMVIGFAGTFFGNLIKAAVSRQREYLADASAVQFTRDPTGIAGALKKIGALHHGSRVQNPGAAELSHAFFAQGVSGFMQSLAATHPPLEERIRRIDPQWDGRFPALTPQAATGDDERPAVPAPEAGRENLAAGIGAAAAGAAAAEVAGAIDAMGNPGAEALVQARALLAELPAAVRDAAHEPYGGRAVVYLLLLDRKPQVRERQLALLRERADPGVRALLERLLPHLDALGIRHRLPLLDVAMPALKRLSGAQYEVFRANVLALIEADARVDMLEWSLQRILLDHLDAHFLQPPAAGGRALDPGSSPRELALILSLLAHAGHAGERDAERAFAAAARALGVDGLELCAPSAIRLPALDRAVSTLARLRPPAKRRLLEACVACVAIDQHVAAVELELLRAFSCVLDCPLPPLPGALPRAPVPAPSSATRPAARPTP